jgi:nicotinamide mononucleotide transporter
MVTWINEHIIEIFGAVTGIIYVILEIRRNILLWPLGIVTSAVYIIVFGKNGFYAGMVLQGYYVVISIYGWIRWQGPGSKENGTQGNVNNIDIRTALFCLLSSTVLWALLWYSLDRWTDSPVPLWDGLITSLSVVATWMLTRKIIEQWYVWIVANSVAVIVYLAMGMYPTAVLFVVYTLMAMAGIHEWRKTLNENGKTIV